MATVSTGSSTWRGDLASGDGLVTAASGLFADAPVTWAARSQDRSRGTSPEELVAAAHASCFSMALAGALGRNRTPPTRLDVTARVTFDKVGDGFAITASDLELTADVPGLDDATLRRLAEEAKAGCPVSRALQGNVRMSVTVIGTPR